MPAFNPKNNSSSSSTPPSSAANPQRTTFRPPWVKDGPQPIPMPSAPWTPRVRDNANTTPTAQAEKPTLRKQTKISIPIEPTDTGAAPRTHQEKVIPIKVITESSAATTPINNQSTPTANWRKDRPQASPERNINQRPPGAERMTPVSSKPPTAPAPPPPPPPPMAANNARPPPPPLPPPFADNAPQQQSVVRTPLTQEKAAKIEALRSRPRRRPDWSDMMKEVESGKKLKHVQCNDRSAPVLPEAKAKDQFVYESEKKEGDSHNKLLKQIQSGVRLKKVRTNDRSRPNLDGLRKFRKQMTIEEQIQKSVSMADVVAAAVQPDELDDIDKVRDDLQSAKQMLALELRNKEAMERDNKRLIARLANLEAELEKEKASRKAETQKDHTPIRTDEDEKLIVKLKEDAAEADRVAKDMENKYHTTAEQLDNTRRKLESAWLRNQELELQLKSMSQGNPTNQLMKQPSKKFIPIANGGSVDLISDSEEESETESEEESENEGAATQERQIAREMKLLTTKLRTFREKQTASLKERRILRDQLKKKQKELKGEKKKYKLLQKEVEKMAKLMKETEEGDEEYDEDVQEEEEESDTESESESESEESADEEIPPNATTETKKKILLERTKKHENRLSSLKKGNNLMRANIERLQDDVNKQREMSLTLQEDLNNILADLG
ncbi:coiled-coil domain-containing protein 102A-like isoform X2 [Planococcus citri]|uniref:coiled-coil domain-containing protein 102A-like isoform X2 n=1 Tax=Planococcus citri TaxID=170843 RepID=UPI0031F9B151